MKKEKFCTLVIMDGFGEAPESAGNAIFLAGTPNLDELKSKYPHTLLTAHGEEVGVVAGQMGDSEIGHMNIGGGRVVMQSLLRINNLVKSGEFFVNKKLIAVMNHVNTLGSSLHVMGLVSDGGVHSHTSHLRALLLLAKKQNVKNVYIHVVTDGRDTPVTSGIDYVKSLEEFIETEKVGKIASVCGRLYAMDREENYDRTYEAYKTLVYGKGQIANSAEEAIKNSYAKGVTDEFILPTIIHDNGIFHTLENNDSFIFFNYRKDRPRQIMASLCEKDFNKFETKELKNLMLLTFTQVNSNFVNVLYAFDDAVLNNGLSETISKDGFKQLKVAETTKYAHVTYYFNGTIEKPFEGEKRELIETIKLKDFSMAPKMRANEITEKAIEGINSKQFKLIVVNLSNCDMVGHTGNIFATKEAVKEVDRCACLMAKKTIEAGGFAIVTADHGNADEMISPSGAIQTSHSLNPVPFILVSNKNLNLKLKERGKLSDIAPTILKLLGLKIPQEMNGNVLIED
ncbi:MAG: 2,3-bisphosphoglycerate-independent phosphoglycerate mutase [Clostridia bacterium]